MNDLRQSYSHLFDYPFHNKPISWGKDGRTHKLIVERIKKFEDELKEKNITCLVGGDMNFDIERTPHYQQPKFKEARTQFMADVKNELCAYLEKKRQRDSKTGDVVNNPFNTELDKQLVFIKSSDKASPPGFNFQQCFMAKLNMKNDSIIEFNFPDLEQENSNLLFGKYIKDYFDVGTPEFQMKPVNCLRFLNNTHKVYSEAVELAKPLGISITPSIQHIHFSVWKDGKNLTTRKGRHYRPDYIRILESVAHLTHNATFLLYPLKTDADGWNFQHMRISEDKIGIEYEMTLRALKNRYEFRAMNNHIPHLALGLLLNVAGVHMGMTKHTEEFCEKHGIWDATPKAPMTSLFPDTNSAMINRILKQCDIDKNGYLALRNEWPSNDQIKIDRLFFDYEEVHEPMLLPQLLAQIQIKDDKFIVPNHFDAVVNSSYPVINDKADMNNKRDHGKKGQKLCLETPKFIRLALNPPKSEQPLIYDYNTLIYERPDIIGICLDRESQQLLRKNCFTDPLLKEYFGSALTSELAKDYNRAFDAAYPQEKNSGVSK